MDLKEALIFGGSIFLSGYVSGMPISLATHLEERGFFSNNSKKKNEFSLSLLNSETSSSTGSIIENEPEKINKGDILIEEIFLAPFWPLRHSKLHMIPSKLKKMIFNTKPVQEPTPEPVQEPPHPLVIDTKKSKLDISPLLPFKIYVVAAGIYGLVELFDVFSKLKIQETTTVKELVIELILRPLICATLWPVCVIEGYNHMIMKRMKNN